MKARNGSASPRAIGSSTRSSSIPRTPQRVILGTEREGVQISENGGADVHVRSNTGFHHQHILDVAMDRERPERALVVLTFDTNAFLATKDGGATWAPLGPGLKRTDLKHVYASPDGWLASLNNGGLMKYDETSAKWVQDRLVRSRRTGCSAAPAVCKGQERPAAAKKPHRRSAKAPQLFRVPNQRSDFASDAWYAATTGWRAGLARSRHFVEIRGQTNS